MSESIDVAAAVNHACATGAFYEAAREIGKEINAKLIVENQALESEVQKWKERAEDRAVEINKQYLKIEQLQFESKALREQLAAKDAETRGMQTNWVIALERAEKAEQALKAKESEPIWAALKTKDAELAAAKIKNQDDKQWAKKMRQSYEEELAGLKKDLMAEAERNRVLREALKREKDCREHEHSCSDCQRQLSCGNGYCDKALEMFDHNEAATNTTLALPLTKAQERVEAMRKFIKEVSEVGYGGGVHSLDRLMKEAKELLAAREREEPK